MTMQRRRPVRPSTTDTTATDTTATDMIATGAR